MRAVHSMKSAFILGWPNGGCSASRLPVQRRPRCSQPVRSRWRAAMDEIRVQSSQSHAVEMARVQHLGESPGDAQTRALYNVYVACGTSTSRSDGKQRRLLAFTPEAMKIGATVPVNAQLALEVPDAIDAGEAVTLIMLALHGLASLAHVGIYSDSDVRGKKVVVIGGFDGGVSSFLTQLLSSWGAHVHSVTMSNAYRTKAIGARSVVDPRKSAFCETIKDFDFVIDSLGDERMSSAPAFLERAPYNALYSTAASPLLLRACGDGLLRGAATIARLLRGGGSGSSAGQDVFYPHDDGLEALRAVLKLAHSGAFAHVPKNVVSSAELFEALRWPRDSDSGGRFGFPGASMFEVDEYVNADDGEPELEEEGASMFHFNEADESSIVVESAEQVKDAIRSTKDGELRASVLFVGASWCRRCKELLPAYRQLAERMKVSQPEVRFMMMDADALRGVAKTLSITDVPDLVVFQGGARVPAWLNTQSGNLMEMSILNSLQQKSASNK